MARRTRPWRWRVRLDLLGPLEALQTNVIDYDLLNATFMLAKRAADYPLAIHAMELRIQGWPQSRAAGYAQLGNLYASGLHDPQKAVEAFRKALELTPPGSVSMQQEQIPPEFWSQLGLSGGAPAAPALKKQN
jgi:tetratricopeptide (TPR) repeat protein